MKYGYTVADQADDKAFSELAEFVEKTLHYKKDGEVLSDVDGSLYQKFSSEGNHISIESSKSIDYVALISDTQIQLKCLHGWIAE